MSTWTVWEFFRFGSHTTLSCAKPKKGTQWRKKRTVAYVGRKVAYKSVRIVPIFPSLCRFRFCPKFSRTEKVLDFPIVHCCSWPGKEHFWGCVGAYDKLAEAFADSGHTSADFPVGRLCLLCFLFGACVLLHSYCLLYTIGLYRLKLKGGGCRGHNPDVQHICKLCAVVYWQTAQKKTK